MSKKQTWIYLVIVKYVTFSQNKIAYQILKEIKCSFYQTYEMIKFQMIIKLTF